MSLLSSKAQLNCLSIFSAESLCIQSQFYHTITLFFGRCVYIRPRTRANSTERSGVNVLPNASEWATNDSLTFGDARSDGGTIKENARSVRTIFGRHFKFGRVRDQLLLRAPLFFRFE
ncbi:hypothetical protein QTP88_005217 [Uroleucon formosanum]